MKHNISILRNCYGCGVCVKACPVDIISLKENEDGFYSPRIDEQDKCIECGLCLKACAFNHDTVSETSREIGTSEEVGAPREVASYAAWSNDGTVRQWGSSGGIGFEIGRHLIGKGYRAIGVRYNPATHRAEHYIASTIEEFMPSAGSKYIPSTFEKALLEIDLKQKYLVTGTPCQIDSFRRLIRNKRVEDNFVLLDFFCHGVPSLLLWDKYLAEIEQKIGPTGFVSWRNKLTGWHDSYSMQADPRDGSTKADPHGSNADPRGGYNLSSQEKEHLYSSRYTRGDLFYTFFLGNYCLNECCYDACKYKMTSSAADIRIGDLWGNAYKDNEKGVSVALAFTEKGKRILSELKDSCTLTDEPLTVSIEGQMTHCAKKPSIRNKVIRQLQSDRSLREIKDGLIFRYRLRFLPERILNRIKRILNR